MIFAGAVNFPSIKRLHADLVKKANSVMLTQRQRQNSFHREVTRYLNADIQWISIMIGIAMTAKAHVEITLEAISIGSTAS